MPSAPYRGGWIGGTPAPSVSYRGVRDGLLQRWLHHRTYKWGSGYGIIVVIGWGSTLDSMAEFAAYDPLAGDASGYVNMATEVAIYDFLSHGFGVALVGEDNLWGNATSVAHMEQVYQSMRSSGFVKGSKVAVVGWSAGGLTVTRYAEEHPSHVSSIIANIPAVDPQYIWDNDPFGIGIKASITAAHGGRPSDAMTPRTHGEDWQQFQMRVVWSTDDAFLGDTPEQFAIDSHAERVNQGGNHLGQLIPGHFIDSALSDSREWCDWIAARAE